MLCLIISTALFSQSAEDALRYSLQDNGGTARFNAMAGAFGALGGDFSTLSVNPAGIGVYRRSEFTFTPALRMSNTSSIHNGTSMNDNKLNFNFNGVGAVFVFDHSNPTGWQSTSIGIGYNRLDNYHNRYSYSGDNSSSSVIDGFVNELNDLNISPDMIFDEGSLAYGSNLAWEAYLVDTANGKYISALPNYGQNQRGTVTSSGANGETVFSFGGNYANKLYLGATLGLDDVRYILVSTYTETPDPTDTTAGITSFTIKENVRTEGSGYNLKLGFIYRIHDYVRIGAAFHSPTVYTLRDSWNTTMESVTPDGESYSITSPDGAYDYMVTTPFRAIASVGLVFGRLGLVNIDYEYVDPSLSAMRDPLNVYDFNKENQSISNDFKPVTNIRIGTEIRLDQFRIRGGYAQFGNPYASTLNVIYGKTKYTVGMGYKEKGFFADIAYTHTIQNSSTFIYNNSKLNKTEISTVHGQLVTTFGWRF